MLRLVPRLNYHYSLKDAFIGFWGIFKKRDDDNAIRSLFNNRNIVYVNHARTGLRIALNSLNLVKGSGVGIQVYNCHTAYSAIEKAGYKPVFIDIKDSFQLDIDDLKTKRSEISALVVTHLFGIPADMDRIKDVIPEMPVIEDCAHSFLSKYKGKLTGSLADIGVFSIGKAKFPSIGNGGFIVVNNIEYLDFIKTEVDSLNKPTKAFEFKLLITNLIFSILHFPFIYRIFTYPYLKKLDEKRDFSGKFDNNETHIPKISKSLFIYKLNTNIENLLLQQKNAKEILIHYPEYSTLDKLISDKNYDSNFFMLPLLVTEKKKEFIEWHKKNGIELAGHFSRSIDWARKYGYRQGQCSNSEKIASSITVFPTYRKMDWLNKNI